MGSESDGRCDLNRHSLSNAQNPRYGHFNSITRHGRDRASTSPAASRTVLRAPGNSSGF